MKKNLKLILALGSALLLSSAVMAKLPAPSDDAKAKAAEAAAKTAWSGKLEAYQLCKAQDKAAANYKKAKPAVASACADPGPFVYTPAVAGAAPAVATAASAPAAVASAKKP